ncbi:MAG TPA: hypothetical protein VGJ20_45185 [Xanthobacteraceae bacterium]
MLKISPKFGLWKKAVLRVIETREARDGEKPGTKEWEAANGEYRPALEGYRRIRLNLKSRDLLDVHPEHPDDVSAPTWQQKTRRESLLTGLGST